MKQQLINLPITEPTGCEEPDIARLRRIAAGVEMLERMALRERDTVRQDALYLAFAEAKCIG